ncbi:MAG: phenylalanine--tRNA ligase subunit alpha [Methanomassiliicoccales archaeon]|nr:MAG: phenylalanine--tRNA ligase subunit alpha [Methanomassiliicoccales archaeon]
MSEKVIEELSNTEKKFLLVLKELKEARPEEILSRGKFSQLVEVMNAASWLQSKKLVIITEKVINHYSLAKKQVALKDLPERRALKILKKNRGMMDVDALKKSNKLKPKEVQVAIGWLKRKKWATLSKREGKTVLEITEKGKSVLDTKGEDEKIIEKLSKGELPEDELDPEIIKMLLSRQDIIKERSMVQRSIRLTDMGNKISAMPLEFKEQVSQLSPELLQTEKWKEVELRKYDVDAFAPRIFGGAVHPMQRLIKEISDIFLQMGFTEIETDFIHSCFWNMDALFIPQDHPARDAQDTFYMKSPDRFKLDEKLINKIKDMHEHGGELPSKGWGYRWNLKEAEKAILRTHTTVNTIKYLSEHPDPPVKVFSIGRVFRREALDSTHLPEFHQIEGIVMEERANLKMLIGILTEFYKRIGFKEIRIRPGYFPYTEPSLEVEIRLKGKWLEYCGAGIFRPEVTSPFGVKHPVLAWGLGLERLGMLRYNIKDIRSLYFNDIEWLRSAPII